MAAAATHPPNGPNAPSAGNGPSTAALAAGVGERIEVAKDWGKIELITSFTGDKILVNRWTAEKVRLNGDWELIEVDDFTFLARYADNAFESDEALEPAETCYAYTKFDWVVYRRVEAWPCEQSENDLIVLQSTWDQQPTRTLLQFRTEFMELEVTWPVGVCGMRAPHTGLLMLRERKGSNFWWKLMDIHRNCNLKSCAGEGGVGSAGWVQRRFRSWQRFFDHLAIGFVLFRGRAYGGASDDDPNRSQDWPVVSSTGLLLLLGRLSFHTPAHGGLLKDDQEAVKQYFAGLLKPLKLEAWELTFCWSPGEVNEFGVWTGNDVVKLTVHQTGWIDGGALWTPVANEAEMFCMGRLPKYAHSGAAWPVEKTLLLEDLLLWMHDAFCADSQLVGPVLVQIAAAIAQQFEKQLSAAMEQGSGSVSRGGYEARIVEADSMGRTAKHRQASAYWLAGAQQAHIHRSVPWSITCDATRIGGRNVYDCALVFPSNIGFWLPPKEGADYIGQMQMLQDGEAEKEQEAKDEWRERCRNFLKRRMNEDAKELRPRKRHRVKAWHFVMALDDQFKVGCQMEGLARFLKPKHGWDENNPLSWPILTICSDSGPDIWSAMQFLTRTSTCEANIVLHLDINHQAWNCAKAALKHSGMWSFTLLMVATVNMRHGPFSQAMRQQQCDRALEDFLAMERPSDGVLFQELFPKICRDYQVEDQISEPGMEDWVWAQLAAAHPWKVKGTAVNLNRWFAIVRELKSQDEHWHSRLIPMLYACLQLDLLRDTKFESVLSVRPSLAEKEGIKHAMKDTTPEQRSQAASSANMLVTATMMHMDPENQSRCRLLCTVLGPLDQWQSNSNKELRSSPTSMAWHLTQVRLAGLEVIMRTMNTLETPEILRFIGFSKTFGPGEKRRIPLDAPMILRDEELANAMGRLAIGVAREFLHRELWRMRGWPSMFLLLSGAGPAEARDALQELKMDSLRFEHLQQEVDRGANMRDVLERSVFKLTPVKQVVLAYKQNGWRESEEIKRFLNLRFASLYQSQLAEDGFNTARRMENRRGNGQARGEAVYHSLVGGKILSRRHEFCEVDNSSGQRPLGVQKPLPKSFYKVPVKGGDERFSKISGFDAKPKWYTCAPSRYCVQFADLGMLEIFNDLRGTPEWHEIDNRWLNFFLEAPILIRRKEARGIESTEWSFALGEIPGSAALVWPSVPKVVGDTNESVYYHFRDTTCLHWLCITDLEEYEGMTYEWRSPSWQCNTWSDQRVYGSLIFEGVRAFPTCKPTPLLRLAADNGFWQMGLQPLKRLARHLGVPDATKLGTLFEVVHGLTVFALGEGADGYQVAKRLKKRVVNMTVSQDICAVECLGFEEGLQLLDKDERDAFEDRQKKLTAEQQTLESFAGELMQFQKKRKGASAARMKRSTVKIPTTITQEAARTLLPPEASIWRDLTRGGWAGHFKPYTRVSAMTARFGEKEAMLRVVRALWRQYLLHNSMSYSECWIEGLFEEAKPSSNEGVAASSSRDNQ